MTQFSAASDKTSSIDRLFNIILNESNIDDIFHFWVISHALKGSK